MHPKQWMHAEDSQIKKKKFNGQAGCPHLHSQNSNSLQEMAFLPSSPQNHISEVSKSCITYFKKKKAERVWIACYSKKHCCSLADCRLQIIKQSNNVCKILQTPGWKIRGCSRITIKTKEKNQLVFQQKQRPGKLKWFSSCKSRSKTIKITVLDLFLQNSYTKKCLRQFLSLSSLLQIQPTHTHRGNS